MAMAGALLLIWVNSRLDAPAEKIMPIVAAEVRTCRLALEARSARSFAHVCFNNDLLSGIALNYLCSFALAIAIAILLHDGFECDRIQFFMLR